MVLSIEQIYAATIKSIYAARDAGDFGRVAWLDAQSYRIAYLRGAT